MNDFGVRDIDVVVVGAGQAGLSGAYHLRRSGLEPDR
ncbi:FAD-binding protein, partial [Streptomyces scopuliridis]